MKLAIQYFVLGLTLFSAMGCGKSAAEKDAAKAAEAAQFKKQLSDLDARVANLKTGDDFSKFASECVKLSARPGITTEEWDKVCKHKPYVQKGKIAIAESRPNVPGPLCLVAEMNVGELVAAGVDKAANEQLLADVKKACHQKE